MSHELTFLTGDADRLIYEFAPISGEDWKVLTSGMARRVHGVFASTKMRASIPWRNRAERDLMFLLEADARILAYEHLADRIALSVGGRRRVHYPSFRVRTANSCGLVDVFRMPPGRPASEHLIARLVTEACERDGRSYRALTETEVHMEPRFGNALHVLRHRRLSPDPEVILRVSEVLSQYRGGATVRQVAERLSDELQAAPTVFAMALRTKVVLDFSATTPLDMRAALRVGGLS